VPSNGARPLGYNPPVIGALLPLAAMVCLIHPSDLDSELGRRALPWMPPDFARQVVRHRRDFARGAAAAATWPATFHRPGQPDGVEPTIAAQCQRLVQALRQQAPFADVVAGLGALAHLTLDLEGPFAGDGGQDADGQAFAAYLRSCSPRVPIVFYGREGLRLTASETALEPYLVDQRQRAEALRPLVRADFGRIGGPAAWRTLDDRSTTFGAASLTLNHATSIFATLTSWIWLHAGGLVPEIPVPNETVLVWKGEPKPRDAPGPTLGFRQAWH
jgi:hypothetical protein